MITSFFYCCLIVIAYANPVSAIDIFPLQEGNVWYYSYHELSPPNDPEKPMEPILITGTEVISDTLYYEFGTPDGIDYYVRKDDIGNVYYRQMGYCEQLYYSVVAEIGESWDFTIHHNGEPWVYRITCLSKSDTVTTAAGTFTGCYKYSNVCLTATDGAFSEWLAPGVGKVRTYCGIFAGSDIKLVKATIDGNIIPEYPEPLVVLQTTPEANTDSISVNTREIKAVMSFYVNPDTITDQSFIATGRNVDILNGTTISSLNKYMTTVTLLLDNDLPSGETINVTISTELADYTGATLSEPFTFSFTTASDIITGNEFTSIEPQNITLTNHPNPFNPSTAITYTLTETCDITLSVFSVTGQKVAVLVDETMSAGTHSAEFNGSNMASGIYFYRLETTNLLKTGKMLLVK